MGKTLEMESGFKLKEEALVEREQLLRDELTQKLRIQIKNEQDAEFNAKMDASRKHFASQLSGLQEALSEAHDTTKAMRAEIDNERVKFKELQSRDNEKSDRLLTMQN